jgi:hypothetical protein
VELLPYPHPIELPQKGEVMEKIARLLKETPVFSGFDMWSLEYLAGLAERKEYKSNEWLFHEFTPREWFGIGEKSEVHIVRGTEEQYSVLAIVPAKNSI